MVTTQKHLTGDIHYTKESEHGDASSIKQDSKKEVSSRHTNNVVKTLAQSNKENKCIKRRRCIPKAHTPERNNQKLWCLCQKEDVGIYILCDEKKEGCLEFYHPECVGLPHLKTKKQLEKYSNCIDGKSYICPSCASKKSRNKYRPQELLSLSDKETDDNDPMHVFGTNDIHEEGVLESHGEMEDVVDNRECNVLLHPSSPCIDEKDENICISDRVSYSMESSPSIEKVIYHSDEF